MKLNEKKLIWLVLFITVVVLVLPLLIRWSMGNHTLMGEFPYHHLKLAEETSLLWNSKFFTPYDLILTGLNSLIKTNFWSVFLPVIFGLGSVLLFYDLLRKIELKKNQKFFIILFLILSPVFVYFFTFSSQNSLAIFLMLLTFNFLSYKKIKFLAWPLILIMPFFDILTTITALLFLVGYWLLTKEKYVHYLIGVLFLLTVLLQVVYPQPWVYEPLTSNWINFFSDLGSLSGFNIFFLVLSILGILVTWKKRKIYYISYPIITIFLFFSFFLSKQINFYLAFILSFFASEGLYWLWKREWKINFLKNLSIIILIGGLIFTMVINEWNVVTSEPNELAEESLIWLKDNAVPGIVLSQPNRGFWIETMAEKEAFVNYYSDNFEGKLEIIQEIFYSRELKKTISLLEENQIRYIWIDQDMRRGEVWLDDDEGLLFLFRNERFKNIYSGKSIEIWEFK